MVGPAKAAAHDGIDEEGGTAQGVRYRSQSVRLRQPPAVLQRMHPPTAPTTFPARQYTGLAARYTVPDQCIQGHLGTYHQCKTGHTTRTVMHHRKSMYLSAR